MNLGLGFFNSSIQVFNPLRSGARAPTSIAQTARLTAHGVAAGVGRIDCNEIRHSELGGIGF